MIALVMPIVSGITDLEAVDCYKDVAYGDIIKYRRKNGTYEQGKVVSCGNVRSKVSALMVSYYKEVTECTSIE